MLTINCFNGFQVWVDKRPLTHFYSQKTRALLAYLAVEAGRQHERSHLAGLLWPDYPETRARRNLSQTLTMLRQDLGAAATLLQSSNRAISLAEDAALMVDVRTFEQGLTTVRHHPHTNPLTCPHCIETMQQTAVLYSGSFLDQFAIGDSPLFENWLEAQRERLQQQAIDLLTRLSNSHAAQGKHEPALQTVDRLLTIAPWQESAHRQRMRLLAQQGQRIQALAQYDTLTNVLLEEFGVAPAAETDALYDQILVGEVGGETAVSPSSTLPIPFHAPTIPPHFVGRTAELGQIQRLLAAQSRRIAIVGMGGVGKTTFAAYVAQQLKPHFADGVLWGNNKVSEVFSTLELWARAYGHDFSAINDLDSKAIAVRDLLANKQVLIIIDNVEDAALARPLLPYGDRTLVLLTTRNLDIATTLSATPIPLIELEPALSQQLLHRILGAKRVTAEAEAAARIGALLHHLPLAVEITAKRLLSRPRMRLAVVAQRLEDMTQRLGLAISDQAVRASFQISWEALTATGKLLFAAMGHFAGLLFLPQALAAVVAKNLLDVEDELFTLAALSLVYEEGERHYRQHPLLADFAAEKLALVATEQHAQQQRLLAYYRDFVQAVGADYVQLEPEWEQITAVIHLAHQQQQWQQLLHLADTLTPAWKARGRYTHARQAYHLALEAAQKLGNREQEALILRRWGEACLEQNDYTLAQERLTQSLTLYHHLEEGAGIAQTEYLLARLAISRDQHETAVRSLQQSAAIFQLLGDQRGLGNVRLQQGYIALREFRLAEASYHFEAALALYEAVADQLGSIEARRLMAHVALDQKNDEQAEQLALTAKAMSEESQDQAQLASTLYLLTGIYRSQQKFALAREQGTACLPILRQTGRRRTEGLLLRQMSLIETALGDVANALVLAQQSLAIFESLNDRRAAAAALSQLGNLLKQQGQLEQARVAWQRATTLAQEVGHLTLLTTLKQQLETSNSLKESKV